MARPKKVDINSDNRREELIVAAARLFRAKGFHGTTMRDIAAAIRMQPGSPFYHFASKQDLLFAGVQKGLSICLEGLEAIPPNDLSPFEYFRALTRTHVGYLLEDQIGVAPLVVEEWRHLEGANREAIKALRRRYEVLWLAAFRRLKQAGMILRADKTACWFFLGALHSVHSWFDPSGKATPQQIADDLVDWIICSQGPSAPVKLRG